MTGLNVSDGVILALLRHVFLEGGVNGLVLVAHNPEFGDRQIGVQELGVRDISFTRIIFV